MNFHFVLNQPSICFLSCPALVRNYFNTNKFAPFWIAEIEISRRSGNLNSPCCREAGCVVCGLCAWASINCQYWIERELCCVNNCNLFKSEAEWQKIRTFPTKLQDVCLPFSSCITDLFPKKRKEKKRKTSLSYCYCAECRRSTGSDSHCLLFLSFWPVFPAAVASIPPCQKRCKKKKNDTTKTKKQKSTAALTSEIILQLLREPPLRCQCESKWVASKVSESFWEEVEAEEKSWNETFFFFFFTSQDLSFFFFLIYLFN